MIRKARRFTPVLLTLAGFLLGAGTAAAGLAEGDHHMCYKFKDVNEVAGPDIVAMFGGVSCDLKVKAKYWCNSFARDNDDDVRGGPVGQTVCYKVKCADSGGTITNLILDTFVGTHGASAIDFDKPKFVCAPIGSD